MARSKASLPPYLAVRNFAEYQHYKDRNPAWIKLYVSILRDAELNALAPATRLIAILLLAVAAQRENSFPSDPHWLAVECSLETRHATVALRELCEIGYLVEASEETQVVRQDWPSRYVSPELRAELFEEAEHKCASCGVGKNLEIDHVIPISKGGTGDKSNLQVLCRSCNRAKRVRSTRVAPAEQNATQVAGQEPPPPRSPSRTRPPARGEAEAEREEERTAEQSVSVVRPAALPNKESLEQLGQRLENANGRAAYGTVDSVYEVIDKPAANTRRELEKWLAPLPAALIEHVREQVLACEPRKSKAAYAVGTAQRLARERGAA